MSSNGAALLSATFHEAGDDHVVEIVHQRDREARRRLSGLRVIAYDSAGAPRAAVDVDPRDELLDLDALLGDAGRAHGRLMVTLDARYDPRVFPYRPHHYAYLHRRGAAAPPLYYAVNATLGGVPDRIGAIDVALNNFECYLFRRGHSGQRWTLLLGNVALFADAEVEVITYHGEHRTVRPARIAPKAHAEVSLPAEAAGRPLRRVELKALFRVTSYIAGRTPAGELVVFDHLFTYFK